MLRFLLIPLVVIQLFMMFGSPSGDVRVGWDPNGGTSATSSEAVKELKIRD
jgi:hypothetical protein